MPVSLSEKNLTQHVCKDFPSFIRRENQETKRKFVEFSTQKLFQIRACVISELRAKRLDATSMFTFSLENTPLDQSERA